MSGSESRYIDKQPRPVRCGRLFCAGGQNLEALLQQSGPARACWERQVREELPRFIPFLTRKCGLEFYGRLLEIGAGGCWFSAELSKLPRVVEVVATDCSARLLKELAPRVFKLLDARESKITRVPADFHRLDFPANHFDYVVCSAALHQALNVVTVLREAHRVLRPGGRFVAIREPVWPLLRFRTRRSADSSAAVEPDKPGYTLDDYRQFFEQAGFGLVAKRVNLSSGFKYYFNEVVNGLTHARYVFVATKPPTKVPARRPERISRATPVNSASPAGRCLTGRS